MSKKGRAETPRVDTRFRKGQSGNPKGRPKGTKAKTTGSAFDVLLDKTLTVTQGGVQRELTVDEALQYKTYQEAIAGNRSARREVIKMIDKREKALEKKKSRHIPFKRLLEPTDPDNLNPALLILGIACRDKRWENEPSEYEHFLLEPWAVQAALSRRRGGNRLSDQDVSEIKRCTRDPNSLRWPRGTGE